MARRRPQGLISVRVPPEPAAPTSEVKLDATVTLPQRHVLEAGVDKFVELTKIGVGRPGTDAFRSFDFHDRTMLRVVLGLVYLHMEQVLGEDLARRAEAAKRE